jgi:hypothetical protein
LSINSLSISPTNCGWDAIYEYFIKQHFLFVFICYLGAIATLGKNKGEARRVT